MKLIVERVENIECITETNENDMKDLYITGVFLQSEVKNRNGRLYPMHVMEKAVDNYTKTFIEQNRALGELGHPKDNSIEVDQKNASHKIISLVKEGNNFIGKALVMNTPTGQIVKELHRCGVKLAVSSRGLGSIQEGVECNIVKDDFMLCTAADVVSDPSAPEAFVDGVLEGKEWIWDNGRIVESRIVQYEKEIKKSRTDDEIAQIFENYLKEFSKNLSVLK